MKKQIKKMSLLNATNSLSRQEMKGINGGKSVVRCAYESLTVKVFGWTIKEGSNYDDCRGEGA